MFSLKTKRHPHHWNTVTSRAIYLYSSKSQQTHLRSLYRLRPHSVTGTETQQSKQCPLREPVITVTAGLHLHLLFWQLVFLNLKSIDTVINPAWVQFWIWVFSVLLMNQFMFQLLFNLSKLLKLKLKNWLVLCYIWFMSIILTNTFVPNSKIKSTGAFYCPVTEWNTEDLLCLIHWHNETLRDSETDVRSADRKEEVSLCLSFELQNSCPVISFS